jgi:hypothetical protein
MFKLSVFVVMRLMTNSNFVGCTTGKPAGCSPLRMRPVIDAYQRVHLFEVRSVTHQAAGLREFARCENRWNPWRMGDKLSAAARE